VIDDLCQLWWMFAIRGLVSIAFAPICYLLSSAAASLVLRPWGYLYLLIFFSLYLCLSGIVLLVGAIYAFDLKLDHRRPLLLDAILHLAIGTAFLMTFGFGLSFSYIVALFGVHAAALGLDFVIMAIGAGKQGRASYVLGLAGTWSLLAGAYMIIVRSLAPDRLLLAASLYTVIFGLLLLLFSIDLRTTHRKLA
jgi:hypothetical protein